MAEDQQPPPPRRSPSPPPPSSKMARLSSADTNVTMAAPPPPGLTFMQLQELQHQALIYKYMVAGVPVPIHLVLPIWKCVAAVPGGAHRYPTLMGWGSLCLDYMSCMEPEPGRCRRTDGKKWRCSRDVVPDQKYCERHMHRGRNRGSRKPVEAPGGAGSGGGTSSGGGAAAALREQADSTRLSMSVYSPSSVLHGGDACKTGSS